jgi:hypothetical protein
MSFALLFVKQQIKTLYFSIYSATDWMILDYECVICTQKLHDHKALTYMYLMSRSGDI